MGNKNKSKSSIVLSPFMCLADVSYACAICHASAPSLEEIRHKVGCNRFKGEYWEKVERILADLLHQGD